MEFLLPFSFWAFSTNLRFLSGLQLEEAEKRLHDSESKLARLRRQSNAVSSKDSLKSRAVNVKVEQTVNEVSRPQPLSKPELVIPAVTPKISQNSALAGNGAKSSSSSRAQSSPSHIKNVIKVEGDKNIGNSSLRETSNTSDRGTKRKLGRILVGQIFSLC